MQENVHDSYNIEFLKLITSVILQNSLIKIQPGYFELKLADFKGSHYLKKDLKHFISSIEKVALV